MKKLIIKTLIACACLFVFSLAANAQKNSSRQTGPSVMKDTGNAAGVIVGSAAKAGWWTTKFAANHIAKPVVVTAAPAAGKYALKQSAKYLLPLAVKLSIL